VAVVKVFDWFLVYVFFLCLGYTLNIEVDRTTTSFMRKIELTPYDQSSLIALCGQEHKNIRFVEETLQVSITQREACFYIKSQSLEQLERAAEALTVLYKIATERGHIRPKDLNSVVKLSQHQHDLDSAQEHCIKTKKHIVRAMSENQLHYIKGIDCYDIHFGVGPAGTGKTFLAVAQAVRYLEQEKVKRILLVRPAVEAGERLGFLPGTLEEKYDPYIRPLLDALYELLGTEHVEQLLEKNILEIAPLAYMRGRTLNDAFIIVDEAQNTTPDQMKMCLTRLGFSSKLIINGDISQIDLPKKQLSGLKHALAVLKDIPSIGFTFLEGRDTVRNPLVQEIIQAYESE
jgi:phosphate starvation-inducible protein PhoH and related proteins